MPKPVKDQIILITGSTDGIGKLTALKLAEQRARVIIHGRNKEKLSESIQELKGKSENNNIEGILSDFSSLVNVRNMAEEVKSKYPELNVLINNAGVGYSDPRYSKDGYELRLAVNYLAPFLLTQLLLPLLRKSAPSRIVNVSSAGQHKINFNDIMMESGFNPVQAYSQSKLALIMYTFELAQQLKAEDIGVNALHPGTYLDTKMVRNGHISPWGKPETGADAEVFLAVSETLDGVTGKYFNVKKEADAHDQAYKDEDRKKLWDLSVKLTRLSKEEIYGYSG
jgi:NAD(P)-dependent dehydrogenase (short-subunit alcohol dehydrogenase family)